VLVVEDNPPDARLLHEAFKRFGKKEFKLTFTPYLEDALGILSKEKMDAVLLDLFLPDALGLEGLARIHEAAPGVPVIILTGVFDETMAYQALQQGAHYFVTKEKRDDESLVRAVRYYAQGQQGSALTTTDVCIIE